jgi:hypothetical protein
MEEYDSKPTERLKPGVYEPKLVLKKNLQNLMKEGQD